MRTKGQGLQCHLQVWLRAPVPLKQWVQAGQSCPDAAGVADACTRGNKAGNYSVKYCAWQWWKAELSLNTDLIPAAIREGHSVWQECGSERLATLCCFWRQIYQGHPWKQSVPGPAQTGQSQGHGCRRTLQSAWPRPEEGGSGDAQWGTAAWPCWWPVPMLCLGRVCMEQLALGRITDRTQTSVYDFTLIL